MSVLKRNSVYYGGGVDISNTVTIRHKVPEPTDHEETSESHEPAAEPEIDQAKLNVLRAKMLDDIEAQLDLRQKELAALKEHYIEQGKEVILEAKRRAEGIIASANEDAARIITEANENRDSVYIKAKSEGFAQGQKDGVEACLAAGRDILDEAKSYAEKINTEKEELFSRYEKEIFETIMTIAGKITLDTVTAKEGTAVKKLIKKAAKEFRNSDMIKITLDKNGATEELAGDYEYLKELCGGIAHVEVELLPDGEPGTVIVDNGSEITDAGVQTQLRMIRELGSGKFRAGSKKKAQSEE